MGRIVGNANKIVNTYIVIIGKFYQNRNGNVQLSQFIVRICGLAYRKLMGKFPLLKIFIFSKGPDAVIHFYHLKLLCVTGMSDIDF